MAKFFIHRPVFAIVISLIILIAGGLGIFTLPIAQYPQISPPTVEVEITCAGGRTGSAIVPSGASTALPILTTIRRGSAKRGLAWAGRDGIRPE